MWCVRLCHWSPVFCATTVLSCGAWACNSATGRFGARGLGSLGLPPVSVLRWVTRYARGAWGCVRCSTGLVRQRDSSSAGARRSVWRATRPAAFCRHTGFVDCGWVFFRRQTRVSRPVCTAFGPALRPPYEQPFALAHCESCTAPRGVAVELKASPHDSASISRCSKAAAVHESGRALVAEVQSCSKRQPPQCCHAKRDSCAVSASVGGVGRHLGSRHKCAPPSRCSAR